MMSDLFWEILIGVATMLALGVGLLISLVFYIGFTGNWPT